MNAPRLLAQFSLSDEEIAGMGALGAFWRSLIQGANDPMAARQGHSLTIAVEPLPEAQRLDAAAAFWRLVGDLAADVLLDDVHGPWGTSDVSDGGILAS